MKKSLSRPDVSHLYKYCPTGLDRLKSVITKSELYFPTPSQLNDPAEAKPKLAKLSLEKICSFLYNMFVFNNPSLSKDLYQQTKAQIEYNGSRFGSQKLLEEMPKILNAEFSTLRIYSMSKRPDNMSLWAKYASNHKGYCLEFSNSGLFTAAREVIYGNTVDFDPTDPDQRNAYILFQKNLDWQTEEEVRLVTPRGTLPIIKFDPNLLTRIIIGQYMPDKKINMIRKWASLRSPVLTIVRAEYNEFEHKISFIPIPL
jgi:hypothetical protein